MPTQKWNPKQYAENAGFVPELGASLIDLLFPQPGEQILDLGCGDGALTVKLLDFGCEVIGVDSSPEMIAAVQARGLNAQVIDGQSLPFNNEFDAVFSNAALHWMKNQADVIAGVRRALKPNGRFVGEMGGFGNVAAIVAAVEAALSARGVKISNPWFFPKAEEYQKLLERGGFNVESMILFPRPTKLPGEISDWLETFAGAFLEVLPANERESAISEIVQTLKPQLLDENGNWIADYVRLRFSAEKSDERK